MFIAMSALLLMVSQIAQHLRQVYFRLSCLDGLDAAAIISSVAPALLSASTIALTKSGACHRRCPTLPQAVVPGVIWFSEPLAIKQPPIDPWF